MRKHSPYLRPRRISVGLALKPSLYKTLSAVCAARNESRSMYVLRLIERELPRCSDAAAR